MSQRLLRLALAPILLLGLLAFAGFGDEYPDLSPAGDPPQDVQGVDMDALRECINGIGGDVPGNVWRCSSVVTDAAAATDSGVNGDNLRECLNVLWRGAPGRLLACTLVVTDRQAMLGDPINAEADELQECLNRMSGLRPGYPRWGSHMSLCPNRIPPALIPYPDLTAQKIDVSSSYCDEAIPSPEDPNDWFCNDIIITNQGDLPAGPFVVTDSLDARVGDNFVALSSLFVDVDPTGGVTCNTTGALPPLTGFQCNFANGLGVGQSVVIWFDYIWDSTCTDAERAVGFYTATNTVRADDGAIIAESDETNNTSAVTYQVTCLLPDLTIDKGGPTYDAGGSITYNITVTNNGAGDASNVVFRDDLPGTTLTATSATPSQGSCNLLNAGRRVECNLGTIAGGGGFATITIDVTWGGDDCDSFVTNWGFVDPDDVILETDETNNSSSITTELYCIA